MKNFKYCPNCKNKVQREDNYFKCSSCDFLMYRHSSATASALPIKDGKVLLAIRGEEPFKGKPDIIGGFCEYGEHPKKTVIRETKEETNLDIKITDILGIYMDEYSYNENVVKTLNTVYVVKIVGGELEAKDDVASLDWYDMDKLPIETISFNSQRKTLRDLQKWYQKNNL